MDDLKKKTVQGGIAKLCGQAVNFVLRLGYLMIITRLLAPEQFGLVAMVTIVTGFYDLFTSAGLSSATVQKVIVTDEQVSTLFWINMFVGAVLCVICLATAPVLVAFYHEPRLSWVTVALAVGFLFNAAGVQHIAILQRELRYVALTVFESIAQLASVAVGITLAVAGFGYWALVAATLAGPATMTVLAWIATGWVPQRPHRNAEIHAMLRFGGTVTLQAALLHVAQNVDKVLLGRVWGADALGIYGRAYQLVNMPMSNLTSAVGWIAFSSLSRLQEDYVRYKGYFLKGYTLVVSLVIPLLVFAAVFADDTVRVVLGAKWTSASLILRLLTQAALVLTITNPPSFWLLHSLGLASRALRIALAFTFLTVLACLVGLPYGSTGVAFAYSTALTIWVVPHLMWCVRGTPIQLNDLLQATWRPLLASTTGALVSFALVGLFAHPIVRLVIGATIMGAGYVAILGFAMRQKSFYLSLFKTVKLSARPT